MQPTVTNQCGAHYDIALQLHPLSTTAAQPSWHHALSDIDKLNFKVSSLELSDKTRYGRPRLNVR